MFYSPAKDGILNIPCLRIQLHGTFLNITKRREELSGYV